MHVVNGVHGVHSLHGDACGVHGDTCGVHGVNDLHGAYGNACGVHGDTCGMHGVHIDVGVVHGVNGVNGARVVYGRDDNCKHICLKFVKERDNLKDINLDSRKIFSWTSDLRY